MTLNKLFNTYKEGQNLEFLPEYRMEHGWRLVMERGKPAQWVTFVERGHNDEESKDCCTVFSFEGEFVVDDPTFLNHGGIDSI